MSRLMNGVPFTGVAPATGEELREIISIHLNGQAHLPQIVHQAMRIWIFLLALANAGNNMAARMAMIAMTTSSSIKVKAARVAGFYSFGGLATPHAQS